MAQVQEGSLKRPCEAEVRWVAASGPSAMCFASTITAQPAGPSCSVSASKICTPVSSDSREAGTGPDVRSGRNGSRLTGAGMPTPCAL